MTGDGGGVDGFIEALLDDDAQALYEQAPCGYLSTTPDGTIIKVNTTFLALTGYRREQLLARKRFADLLTAGGRIYHETHYAPLLRMHGSAREIALDIVCADARRLPALVNSVVVRDAAGEPTVIRTAVFDASHRRRYEQELLRERQRAEASEAHAVALARTLQQTFIPPRVPHIANLEIGAEYRPAGDGAEVGGDFYDIFQVNEDDWFVVIGDVRGKGVDAAVITALARYTLRAAAAQDPSPARALSVLNHEMGREEVDRFCTAVALHFSRTSEESWRITSCAAGHPLPLHITAEGKVTPLGNPGSLIGVLDQIELCESTLILRPGATLIAYTDGVTEARSPDGHFYGDDRLLHHLATNTAGSAQTLAHSLLDEVLHFQHGVARDDIAIITARSDPP